MQSCVLHPGPTGRANHSPIYLLRLRAIKNWREVLQPLNPVTALCVPAVKLFFSLCSCHSGLGIFTAPKSMLRTCRILRDQLYLFLMHFNIWTARAELGKSLCWNDNEEFNSFMMVGENFMEVDKSHLVGFNFSFPTERWAECIDTAFQIGQIRRNSS